MEVAACVLGIAVAVVGGGFVLYCGLALSGGVEPPCDGGCGAPLSDGYEAIADGKFYCRGCAKRLGLRAWYSKQLPNGDWL